MCLHIKNKALGYGRLNCQVLFVGADILILRLILKILFVLGLVNISACEKFGHGPVPHGEIKVPNTGRFMSEIPDLDNHDTCNDAQITYSRIYPLPTHGVVRFESAPREPNSPTFSRH